MKKILFILLLLVFTPACSRNQGMKSSSIIETSKITATPVVATLPTKSALAMTPANQLSPISPEPVTFTTTDGINLAGTLFGEGSTAVILAHQGTPGADQKTWQSFANLLADRGYTALTFDFRGVGQSEGKLLYGNLALDIDAAVQFLQARGYQKIICIGASMGGTACIRAAQDHAFIGLIALASTMTISSDPASMRLTPDNLRNLTQPKLFISANDDYGMVVSDTKRMYEQSPNPKALLLLPGTQHGTNLFDTNVGEELSAGMLRFVDYIDKQASEALPALQPVTTENADKVQLLRTMEIPGYQSGQLSQCSLAFSPDGHLLVGACGKNQVPIWDVQSGFLLRSLYDSPEQIVSCAFSPDGKFIACGGFDKTVTIWNAITGEKIGGFEGHTAPIWELAFDPTGKSLVTCSLGLMAGGSGRGDIRYWTMWVIEPAWSYAGTRDYLSVSFDPSGETLAYGSIGGSVGILDTATGELIRELTDSSRNIGDVAYSPSGLWLAAGSDDNRIYLWDTANYKLVDQLKGHAGYVNGVTFNPAETLLVSGSHDKTVDIWNLAESKLITQLEGHKREVLRVAFSPDGTLIASVSWDGTIRLWGVIRD
jgi:pimeloyl-ACP methyl ester carboxylesterase